MVSDARKSFTETFIVWDDEINLVAALIPSKNGQATIRGTARFKNGKQLAMFSQPDDCKILYQRLVYACRWIADIYGTQVVCSRCPATAADEYAPLDIMVFKNPEKQFDRQWIQELLTSLN
jgi:hypothetical protein